MAKKGKKNVSRAPRVSKVSKASVSRAVPRALSNPLSKSEFNSRLVKYKKDFDNIKAQMGKVVIGQQGVIDSMLMALVSNGNILLEGVPGVAKTLMIRALASATSCSFSRIQFTPDMLPADIIGITAYDRERGFYVVKGPIFANFVLADEINRAPPKTQSALLEAMQEKQATIGKESFPVPLPFFVLATQNPIENIGTYPLPEAQVDRFLLKINVGYPNKEDEQKILSTNISIHGFSDFGIKPAVSASDLIKWQKDVLQIYVDQKIEKYIVSLIDATRNPKDYGISLGKYIEWGTSPRASISIYITAKAKALMDGKTYVTPNEVKSVAHAVMRHRLIINYEGQSEKITTDKIIDEILSKVRVP